jgi:hypothetical protein
MLQKMIRKKPALVFVVTVPVVAWGFWLLLIQIDINTSGRLALPIQVLCGVNFLLTLGCAGVLVRAFRTFKVSDQQRCVHFAGKNGNQGG